jgi:2-oxoglutarate/2-oxoacid ferredoxin oxidoreductase subunit beta
VREHNEAVSRIDFIDLGQTPDASPAPGDSINLPQADGSVMRLRKLHSDHDPTNRLAALSVVQGLAAKGEVATGLFYVESGAADLHAGLNTTATPLNRLAEAELCPGSAALHKLNASLR